MALRQLRVSLARESFPRARPACHRQSLLAASCGALLALAGCNALTNVGGPVPAFDVDKDIAELQSAYNSATSISEYYKIRPETKERRDEFIVGRLTLYNLQYLKFIRQFALESAQLESAFDITKLGVDLSTTLVGGALTKSILGAVSAGLTGSRVSIEKNFFEQKTAQALVTQMNASRKVALVPIVAGLKQSVADYPLASAITDLNAYYEAGTLQGALQSIQADAGVKDAQASKLIDQYRTSVYSADASSERILNWLFPGVKSFDADGKALDATGKPVAANDANLQALRAWLKDNNLTELPIGTFLNNKELSGSRANAIKKLNIP